MWGRDGVCRIDDIINPLDNQFVAMKTPPQNLLSGGFEGREGLVRHFGVGKRIIIFV